MKKKKQISQPKLPRARFYTVAGRCVCGCDQPEVRWVKAPSAEAAAEMSAKGDFDNDVDGRKMEVCAVFAGKLKSLTP